MMSCDLLRAVGVARVRRRFRSPTVFFLFILCFRITAVYCDYTTTTTSTLIRIIIVIIIIILFFYTLGSKDPGG